MMPDHRNRRTGALSHRYHGQWPDEQAIGTRRIS
jgi:hypothetical protein